MIINTTKELIQEMPLKKLDPALLSVLLMNEAKAANMDGEIIFEAISLASFLHSGQTRANRGNLPRTPYIEHPLRNAIRLLRWGCAEQDVIVAAILHDVVEDCALKFVREHVLSAQVPKNDEEAARNALLTYIKNTFGGEVARIVNCVTNPISQVNVKLSVPEKHKIYYDHVVEMIIDDVATLLVKLSDFVDNATGLYHNDFPPKIKLAAKYRPLVPVFRKEVQAQAEDVRMAHLDVRQMVDQLDATASRLDQILA